MVKAGRGMRTDARNAVSSRLTTRIGTESLSKASAMRPVMASVPVIEAPKTSRCKS